jgi:glutaryl-CoA dehydrogenase
MSLYFNEEHQAFRQMARKFVETEISPYVDEWEAQRIFPAHALFKKMGNLGLLGLSYPEEYGGGGVDYWYNVILLEELGRSGCAGVPMGIAVHTDMATPALAEFGSEELKRRFLVPAIAGDMVSAIAVSEPDAGSDVAAIRTYARPDGDDYVINGAKMWITNGTIADVALVWAQTDEDVRGFLVERGTPGFEAPEIEHKFSLRASVTSSLYLDNVRVPQANMLPGASGLKGPLSCLNQARYGIAWGAIGAAQACLAQLLEYTESRVLFERPLNHNQAIQIRLAEMARRITTAQALAMQLGRLKDSGALHPTQVSLAKWNNVRMALDVARDCRDMLGGSGISAEFVPVRHMLNLESVITYEGTETVHQLVVGKELTGVSAF